MCARGHPHCWHKVAHAMSAAYLLALIAVLYRLLRHTVCAAYHNLLRGQHADERCTSHRLLACDKAPLGRQVDLGLLSVLHLQHSGDGHELLQLCPGQPVSTEAWVGILLRDEVRGQIA